MRPVITGRFAIKFTKLAGIAVTASMLSATANAATFSDSLASTTLDPNLSIIESSGFDVALPGGAAYFTKVAGTGNGNARIISNFTFSGNYTLTVLAFGLNTGLTDNEAGLNVYSGGSFSDIFGCGSGPAFCSHNGLSASTLTHTPASGGELLTIAGYTTLPLTLDVFLLQEYGGTEAGAVSFANLRLQADEFSNLVSTTPVPTALPLFCTGLGAMGLLGWRRKRKKVAAMPAA